MLVDPIQSIPAGSTATSTVPVYLDNGEFMTAHTVVVTAATGTTGGVVTIELSQDGVNWFKTAMAALTAAGVTAATINGAYRYVQAAITTTITGGSVGVTVASVK